jgi:hypothetical protein
MAEGIPHPSSSRVELRDLASPPYLEIVHSIYELTISSHGQYVAFEHPA